MVKSKYRLSDGLTRQNIVLMSGTAIAPVAACATDYRHALALSVGFTIIAFTSVVICRFIPKKIVYTIRVILYALIAGLTYIPAYMAVKSFYGAEMLAELGVYLPILVVTPLILTKTETRFSLRPFRLTVLELAGYVTGFNIVCLSVGIIRDILGNRHIGNYEFDIGFDVPALSTVSGGFILVGIAAGIFRWGYNQSKENKLKKAEKELERQRLLDEVS
jgi:electron transport complex protein RnfE